MWMCCPGTSVCSALNQLPYETVEYEPSNFPQNTWILSACAKHAELFEGFPDVPPGDLDVG